MSIQTKFASHSEAVKAGWFSRRHETNAAHLTARDAYQRRLDAKHTREVDSFKRTRGW